MTIQELHNKLIANMEQDKALAQIAKVRGDGGTERYYLGRVEAVAGVAQDLVIYFKAKAVV